ncbi:hypothetical protein A2U01_0091644, partial [Trifolium medium]|nr:hypothetical protein [Trifolium medium]
MGVFLQILTPCNSPLASALWINADSPSAQRIK